MRPLSPKEQQLAPIIRELIIENHHVLNGTMAEIAAKRLGRPVNRTFRPSGI